MASAFDARLITCDEHPKRIAAAQPENPRTDVPSEVRSQRRQHQTLEINAAYYLTNLPPADLFHLLW
jgi:hypothetical protein